MNGPVVPGAAQLPASQAADRDELHGAPELSSMFWQWLCKQGCWGSLQGLTQAALGAVHLHVWSHRAPHLHRPAREAGAGRGTGGADLTPSCWTWGFSKVSSHPRHRGRSHLLWEPTARPPLFLPGQAPRTRPSIKTGKQCAGLIGPSWKPGDLASQNTHTWQVRDLKPPATPGRLDPQPLSPACWQASSSRDERNPGGA